MVEVTPVDVSCSSQDPAFPALNLVRGALKPSDERKQWLCSSPDEKFAHVTLTYEKSFVISSLEIKNNGSAYVQVEGGSSQEPGKYKVLWKTQNLMTPSESRLGMDTDGIYIFLPQDLATAEKDKTWDVLKITCSQPFNKLQKYGLSHVIARSALPVKEEVPSSPSHCVPDVPISSLKREPVEDDTINIVMVQRDFEKEPEHQTQMSSEVSSSGCSETGNSFISPVKQEAPAGDEIFYPSPARAEPSSSGCGIPQTLPQIHQSGALPTPIKRETSLHIPADSHSAEETPVGNSSPLKRRVTESESSSDSSLEEVQVIKRPAPGNIIYKPFNKLLEGVKIVISGFQNPFRSEIRIRAMQMGASYSPFWTENSTHLVCAFLSTPKYRQASAEHGLIVTRDWIDQCFAQRKRLPWRRFALNPSERSNDCAGLEIWELVPNAPASSSSDLNTGSADSPGSSDRPRQSSPVRVIRSNPSGHSSQQNGSVSHSSFSPLVYAVKREVPDQGECSSETVGVSQNMSCSEGNPRQSILQNNFTVSSRQEVSVKREINPEDVPDVWSESASGHRGLSPAASCGVDQSPCQSQTRRSLSSNPSPRHHLLCNSLPAASSASLEHEALRSTAAHPSSMEPGSDGFAGYYRPISQPCAVPHSSPSTTYLVPPVIMLPQTLPQYFVPVSQQFQAAPPSRDTYMARTIPPPQVHGQHIRVIQHSNKAPTEEENAKQN